MTQIYCDFSCYGLHHMIYIFENNIQKTSGYCTFDDAEHVLAEYCNHYKANKLTLKGTGAQALAESIYSLVKTKYDINDLTIEVI